MKDQKSIVTLIMIVFLITSLSLPILKPVVFIPVKAEIVGGVGSSAWHNNSSLSVFVIHDEPRINWYDFQYNNSGTWVSRMNQKIEVDNESEYRFVINISSDQGWEDIEFINLTAWYDNGTESTNYNQTPGGNFNLKIQYENTTETSNDSKFRYLWPDVEVTFGSAESRVVNDTLYGLDGMTEARNISFPFVPNKQFRYAPGNRTAWDTNDTLVGNSSKYGLYNNHSWNFNITVEDQDGYQSWVKNEFGVYRYTEIVSAENPSIVGFPGANFSAADGNGSGYITIITCSNGNYNLSVDMEDLTHEHMSTHTINKSNVYVQGGDRTSFSTLLHTVYLYGGGQDGMTEYHQATPSNNSVSTTDIEYQCYIPDGQLAGQYTSPLYYHLHTQEE